ncbi:hypothetical protein Bca101_077373 [Brassica carinata]
MSHAQIQQKHQRPIHKRATTYGRSPKQLGRTLGSTLQNRTIKAHERNKEAEEETHGMIYTIQTGMRFSAQLALHRLRKKPEEIAGPLVSPELRNPHSLRRNHLLRKTKSGSSIDTPQRTN